MDETVLKKRVEQLVDFIMKKCLWQFHSRAWDRERQNREILKRTRELLVGDPVARETPEDRCYWVDAVYLAESFRSRFDWMAALGREEIGLVMNALHERMDYLTVKGSLNQELKDQHY